MNLYKLLKENPEYLLTIPASRGYLNWIPDKLYLGMLYRLTMGNTCNFKNPVGYNEKLQCLKLQDRNPRYHQMVDKAAVRDYIRNILGEEYLIPIIGIYSGVREIPVDKLPNRFVIKCTHDSGSVEICKNKDKWDSKAALDRIAKALKRDYYSTYREWPYKGIPHRIIIEEYLPGLVKSEVDTQNPIGDSNNEEDLKDYKVMCFSGKAFAVETHAGRFSGAGHTQTFYDRNWNRMDISQEGWPTSHEPLRRPESLEKMIEFSEILSENMVHARIDWYEVNGKLYFGEITFYDGSGFVAFHDKDEKMLGQLCNMSLAYNNIRVKKYEKE